MTQQNSSQTIIETSYNTLTTPLKSYYIYDISNNGTLNLPPIIDDSMVGLTVTFIKTYATNTLTINSDNSANLFQYLGQNGNSNNTQTNIAMTNNFTVLQLAASKVTSISGQYVWSVIISNNSTQTYPQVLTGSASLNFPLYKYYSILTTNNSKAFVIQPPIPTNNLLGTTLTFRRVGSLGPPGTITVNPGVIPLTSYTPNGTLLSSNQNICKIVCLQTFTNTVIAYAWFIIQQD
jgi:hypothetical protein